ncbi:MAG: caspase, EACC1-associated type, partial [Gammaproteobacteria bacterium]
MNRTSVALLVGCSAYDNPMLRQLPARQNVDALEGVLADPEIGGFRVKKLLDQPSETVAEQIEGFFADGKRGDLLLLYFSCHGVLDTKDPRGLLYFATTNTKNERLGSTGISAERVRQWMDNSRSKRIVLLLDCCYSGAFRGLTRGSVDAKEIFQQQLGGHGRVVITASDKLELAHDSVFTDAVVAGLQTGDADRDGDGLVSVYELYQYVHKQVRAKRPDQTPTWSTDGMSGELYLAKNPHRPLPLPDDLDQALRSKTVWQRRGAIYGLDLLLAGDHPGGQKRTARQALLRLLDGDTDPVVRAAAKEVLDNFYQPSDVTNDGRSGHWLAKISLAAAVVLAAVVGLTPVTWPLSPPPPPSEAVEPPCSPIPKRGDGVLSLGTLLPKTGQYIYTGPATEAGVRLAIKDINGVGIIPGSVVKLDDFNQHDEGDSSDNTAV